MNNKVSIGHTEGGLVDLQIGGQAIHLTPTQAGVLATALLDKARIISPEDAAPNEAKPQWEFTQATSTSVVNIPNQPQFVGLVIGFGDAYIGLGFSPDDLRVTANRILKELDEKKR